MNHVLAGMLAGSFLISRFLVFAVGLQFQGAEPQKHIRSKEGFEVLSAATNKTKCIQNLGKCRRFPKLNCANQAPYVWGSLCHTGKLEIRKYYLLLMSANVSIITEKYCWCLKTKTRSEKNFTSPFTGPVWTGCQNPACTRHSPGLPHHRWEPRHLTCLQWFSLYQHSGRKWMLEGGIRVVPFLPLVSAD